MYGFMRYLVNKKLSDYRRSSKRITSMTSGYDGDIEREVVDQLSESFTTNLTDSTVTVTPGNDTIIEIPPDTVGLQDVKKKKVSIKEDPVI